MNKNALKKRRIVAVKKILAKKLPADMKHYWTKVLRALQPWELEKRNLRSKEKDGEGKQAEANS